MTNNGEDSDQDVEGFSDPDVDEVSDDIDDEGPEEVEDVHDPSFYPDAAHASEFPEYADIVPAHRLASNSQFDELFVGQQFENKADCVFAIKQYNMKLSIDYKWLSSMEPWQWAQCFDEGYRYGHMTTNLVEAVNSVLRRTRHLPILAIFLATFYSLATLMPKMGLKQAKQLEAGHCATYSLNVEQYIDDVYTLERTLRIWGNEFPVLRDISTWEVQSPAFETLPDRSLRKRVKGRPTITRIRNDMDVKRQVEPKCCTICRTVDHNRNKCLHENVYTGQSSRSKRN
ncbi:hypothetical protein GOBAR_AA11425 [Gossypium barbadense]|uniref:Transposase MuDR plant domain-containing protein n=1 Tax=Gossypium barbadense TaxID=3634 RepID=A0A2P5Y0W6_GOSBA|nr:hypothetical protein GOBAR_AA11425 [Gossypium barbadense]